MTEKEKLANSIKPSLVNYGIMNSNWRCKIIKIESVPHSDCSIVTTGIYKPYSRKPCCIWELKLNEITGTIHFDESKHYIL